MLSLAKKIACFIGSSERLVTEVPGLLLVRRTGPTAPCSGTYTPSLIVVAQGSKRVDLGQTTFTYDRSRFLLTAIDLPIVSQVVEASEARPLLAVAIKLEMTVVREFLSREEVLVRELSSDTPAMVTGEITVELLNACCRLVDLLASPQDIPFLSGLIQREIIYRLLMRTRRSSPSSDCNFGRSELSHGESDLLDQRQLRENGTCG